MADLDEMLVSYANSTSEDGFQWNGNRLKPVSNAGIAANRLVVLMNETKSLGDTVEIRLRTKANGTIHRFGQWNWHN